MLSIIFANREQFKQHFEELFELYMDVFTTGCYEQYLDRQKNEDFCRKLLDAGKTVVLALDGDGLAGFLVAAPASYDYRMPESLKAPYAIDRCLYISQLAVKEDHRREGIASDLIKRFLESLDGSKHPHVFVRTPIDNKPAIELYSKFGFKKSITIEVRKMKKDRSGKFIEIKQYLVKDLADAG